MRNIFILAFALIAFYALPAKAADKALDAAGKRIIHRVFNETEKAIIEEYFGKKVLGDEGGKKGKGGKKMPPGLAKRDELPPGLARQVERNGHLPPGLAKRDLPDDLKKRLPPAGKGVKRVIAGDDIVLIEEATDIVLDVIYGAAGGDKSGKGKKYN